MTGTAAATLPTSSSVCMIFFIRAWNQGDYHYLFWIAYSRISKRKSGRIMMKVSVMLKLDGLKEEEA